MADIDPVITPRKKRVPRPVDAAYKRHSQIAGEQAMTEARAAGLLDGPTEHVSFRVPKALIDAAKQESGFVSTTELGVTALAMLARSDPFTEFMRRNRRVLGPNHNLEY